MTYSFLENTFKNAPTPIVVCRNRPGNPLVFVNVSAKILINPLLAIEHFGKDQQELGLSQLLRFENPEDMENILYSLTSVGFIHRVKARLINFESAAVEVSISGNHMEFQGENYFILYISRRSHAEARAVMDTSNLMSGIFQAAYHTQDVDAAINKILRMVGRYVRASRAYVFEEISDTMTRNTYEWCAEGIEPVIDMLQNLPKDSYPYDSIVDSGVYVTEDIQTLPVKDRVILEAQNIRALAIITLYQMDRPVGYIGFDDCVACRKWSSSEIQLLKNTASVVVSLIARREAEEQSRRSREILQTISDNIESVIYVNTLDTYEITFTNRVVADVLEKPVDQLIGKTCWQVLQVGQTGPCPFCPIPKMIDNKGNILRESYSWEFQNTVNGRWYLAKDSIIRWIDGRNVHIETAVDITAQKVHEEQLKYFASIDNMTGVYNRDHGYKLMQNLISNARLVPAPVSVCFVDLDGLKYINDTYGHDAGDEMITGVIGAIRQSIRQSDAICRWGGDEFIVLLQCETDVAERLILRAQQALEEINLSEKRAYKLSFSYGITSLTQDPQASIDQVVSSADKKMYEQKTSKYAKRAAEIAAGY
ncbi:diguanylate cyclase [Oscillospiraceae bacterium MB08-C2-2]|nr:diguanylate cyclase [Oscillospiraceae bacterium MB08-C2-2]